MKKVIVKVKLKNRDKFENKLNEVGMDFGPVIWQHDRIYTPKDFEFGKNLPRLIMRTEMKAIDRPARYTVILKRHIEDSGIDVCDETVVKDYAEMVNIIYQLGFKKRAEISRRRQEIEMGEGTKLYLDKVEGIDGFYAKLESEVNDGESVSEVYSDLVKTFSTLAAESVVIRPYFEMTK